MSFTGKSPSETKNDILYVDADNNGAHASIAKVVKTGSGNATPVYIDQQELTVRPTTDATKTFSVENAAGTGKLQVDTTNNQIKLFNIHAFTQYKEFGLYDFSPTQGYHNRMVCNNMMFSDSGDDIIADDSMFSNGTDPATTLDLSANGTASSLVACTWFVQSNITIDEVRVVATCNSSHALNFHLYSYTLDTSSNHGDLSSGTLLAHIGSSMSATNTTMKTDTLTIDSADVDANKVIYAFVENEGGTGDVTCQLVVKYHLR